MTVERIEHNGQLMAIVLRGGSEGEGVTFVSPPSASLQVGALVHRAGARIKAHVHKPVARTITGTMEVLHIESGEVEAEFYDDHGSRIESAKLGPCDTILLMAGGHGFNVRKDSRIIEVKQGPYLGANQDKERLEEAK